MGATLNELAAAAEAASKPHRGQLFMIRMLMHHTLKCPKQLKSSPLDAAKSPMKLLLPLARFILVICAVMLFGDATHAAAKTRLQVSATVQAVASLTLTAQPAQLLVASADIRRGFLTVAQPTRLILRSNSAQGIALDVIASDALFSAISVQGLDGAATLAGAGGTLTHRWAAPAPLPLTLTFTFILKPQTRAGRYPWPVALSVRALETL
jgi:hypothetical protein